MLTPDQLNRPATAWFFSDTDRYDAGDGPFRISCVFAGPPIHVAIVGCEDALGTERIIPLSRLSRRRRVLPHNRHSLADPCCLAERPPDKPKPIRVYSTVLDRVSRLVFPVGC